MLETIRKTETEKGLEMHVKGAAEVPPQRGNAKAKQRETSGSIMTFNRKITGN